MCCHVCPLCCLVTYFVFNSLNAIQYYINENENELSEKLAQVTAENAQHAAANAGLVKAVERVEQTAAMHLATMADVVATLENATLSDTVARAKALEDLRAAVAQAS